MNPVSTPAFKEWHPLSLTGILDSSIHILRKRLLDLVCITCMVLAPLLVLQLMMIGATMGLETTVDDVYGFMSWLMLQMFWPGLGQLLMDIAGLTSGVFFVISSVRVADPLHWVLFGASLFAAIGGVFVAWMEGALTHSMLYGLLSEAPKCSHAFRATFRQWRALWGVNLIKQVPTLIGESAITYGTFIGISAFLAAGHNFTQPRSWTGTTLQLSGLWQLLGIPLGAVIAFVISGWVVSTPVIVAEKLGPLQSLRRSYSLVRGMRLQMVGRILALWIMRIALMVVPAMLIGLITGLIYQGTVPTVPDEHYPLNIALWILLVLLFLLTNIFVTPLYAAFSVVNYLDLRIRKEHYDLELRATWLAQTTDSCKELPVTSH